MMSGMLMTVMLLAAMEKALLLMVVLICAAVAVGIYEAWSRKRGVLGWIVSIVVSVAGGLAGSFLSSVSLEALITAVGERTAPLVQLLGLPAMAIVVLLCSWVALRLVSRFR